MPTQNTTEDIARFKLGEIGSPGLNIFAGITQEELKSDLNFPNNLKTYKLMSYHPSINASLGLYEAMISKVKFKVISRSKSSDSLRKAEIVNQMLFKDMEKSFDEFVRDAMTMDKYGFSVIEKVYRKRNKSSGSIYNDDLIAPIKLALRSQDSIHKFIFNEDGSEILAVKQVLTSSSDPYGRYSTKGNQITIPRSKVMLFKTGNNSDNPFGVSPLRNVYLAWKYISAIEELEAINIQKDLSGVPLLTLPAQYMSSEATPEQKAIYEEFKRMGRNIQSGAQSCIVLPSSVDPDTRQKLFNVELLSLDGKRGFDLTKVKEYYRAMIFIGLQADILIMGNTNTGSFALGSIKNTLTGNAVEGFIKEIVRVVNTDLIRQIYELNQWDLTDMVELDYDGFDQESLDEVGKFVQRISSVGLVERDRAVLNYIRNKLGVDLYPDDEAPHEELLTGNTSKSGKGMTTPFEGTRTSLGDSLNSSDLNVDNAA